MNDFLSKPFDADDLADLLLKYLDGTVVDSASSAHSNAAAANELSHTDGILDAAHLAKLQKLQQPGKPNVIARIASLYLEQTPEIVQRSEGNTLFVFRLP